MAEFGHILLELRELIKEGSSMFTEKNRNQPAELKNVLFLITYTIVLIWVMLHLIEVFDTVTYDYRHVASVYLYGGYS